MKYLSYYLLIITGFLMAIGTFLKLINMIEISSDWFWFLAGIGLGVDGVVTVVKQKRFDKKYKIVLR